MAAAKGKDVAGGSMEQAGSEPSLEDLLQSLNLKGEDIGGVFVAKSEVEALKEGSRWMAVMRLLTPRPYSTTSLKKTMLFAWAPAQDVVFRDMEENRFLVQANCLGDWKKITEQGPWLFRDHGLRIEKYDGSCRASTVELNRIHAWVRILEVPELYRKKNLISELAKTIGEVIQIDMNNTGSEGGDYVRARIWLDVRRSLTRFVSFKPEGGEQVIMKVKYEKIPLFCAVCGLLGHEKEECGSGVHSPGKVGYGNWLLADTTWNHARLYGRTANRPAGDGQGSRQEPSLGRGGGRGGRSGRGQGAGGRGRGAEASQSDSRKRTSAEARLTECTPIKENAGAPLLLTWKEPGVIEEEGGGGAKKQLDFAGEGKEKSYPQRSGTPPPPPSAREQKRPKKQLTPKKVKGATDLAATGSGSRPSQ
ncbi:hypothetical protein QYE76_050934 [Lolium multiflorum]|uniref:CCHC-type domain-containing protein n=1 Tax=Lolium multiflorum TaxID=4521 RepID=A0AAD8SS92_LOLMU|nr:hypothetical protein QYE76_050934 [Lolium multiflorum]